MLPSAFRSRPFLAGIKAIAPLVPPMFAFGMISGVAAADAGVSFAAAMAMAVVIFAGAAQLAIAQLISQDALPVVIVATAFVINLRFAMYSASLAPHLKHLPAPKRAGLAYILSDQAYALSIIRMTSAEHGDEERGHLFLFACGLMVWLTWLPASIAGYVIGAGIPPSWGLGFAVPLSFMALLVPTLKDRPTVAAAAVGGTVAVIAGGLPYNLGLGLGALTGIATGYLMERLREARNG
ncbi:AzlC family ABC transporter permease [Rhodobium gokarnense]|uniref:4-azaleucine resistance transporter AzlC n=1 Tax=Rhodobium gokarnense TaxID=364296 RepID=A0ABT3HI27_9HYPH|nr:AzlC family ABC transporter permease [Rhodobium gokarnense]MCW2310053.1 4-azaleucine resistance transporter AzlC [Rhodobium gokarnense]